MHKISSNPASSLPQTTNPKKEPSSLRQKVKDISNTNVPPPNQSCQALDFEEMLDFHHKNDNPSELDKLLTAESGLDNLLAEGTKQNANASKKTQIEHQYFIDNLLAEAEAEIEPNHTFVPNIDNLLAEGTKQNANANKKTQIEHQYFIDNLLAEAEAEIEPNHTPKENRKRKTEETDISARPPKSPNNGENTLSYSKIKNNEAGDISSNNYSLSRNTEIDNLLADVSSERITALHNKFPHFRNNIELMCKKIFNKDEKTEVVLDTKHLSSEDQKYLDGINYLRNNLKEAEQSGQMKKLARDVLTLLPSEKVPSLSSKELRLIVPELLKLAVPQQVQSLSPEQLTSFTLELVSSLRLTALFTIDEEHRDAVQEYFYKLSKKNLSGDIKSINVFPNDSQERPFDLNKKDSRIRVCATVDQREQNSGRRRHRQYQFGFKKAIQFIESENKKLVSNPQRNSGNPSLLKRLLEVKAVMKERKEKQLRKTI